MTPQEAKRILHPETTLEAYAETDYYGGFNGAKKWKEAVDEACLVACEALEKQIPKKPKTLNYGLLIDYGWKYKCPNCGCAVGNNKNLAFAYGEYLEPYENNCCSCGQALDWSDTE